jgi:hypothetical protein
MTQAKQPQRLPVRVRMVEVAGGVMGEARVAASFSDQTAAEDFIRAEVMKWRGFDRHEGHNRGGNSADHHVRYWTETQQETASVTEHRLHDAKSAAR